MNLQSLRNARTVTLLSAFGRLGHTALASSTVTRWFRGVADQTVTIARTSRLGATIRWGERATRASWIYRWLTAEPEPDVVVIDLRETVVVGPILALLDLFLAPLARNWRSARTGTVADRLSERFVDRPVQVVSLVTLVALFANLLFLFAFGTASRTALGVRLVAVSLALAGTRVRLSANELTETAVYELGSGLLSPPDPPDENRRNGPPSE
jgi:hypothetical protein